MLSMGVYIYLSSTNYVSVNIVFIANGLYGNIQIFFFLYSRRDSASSMFANNAIDTFDALLRKNIYGLKKRIFNINNDLIRVMYN